MMIPISLPSGKVIFVTLEQSLDDDFLQNLMCRDDGYEIDNPFDDFIDRIREPRFDKAVLPDVPEDLPSGEIEKIKKDFGKD